MTNPGCHWFELTSINTKFWLIKLWSKKILFGPWWWSSGQLLLWRSEFESCWSLQCFSVHFIFEKNENKQKVAGVGPFFQKKVLIQNHIQTIDSQLVSAAVWPDWAIFCTLGNFVKPLPTTNLAKSLTFLGNFCKCVKSYHFSSEIIFG